MVIIFMYAYFVYTILLGINILSWSIAESFISNSVHLDGEDAVLVQAILSIKAIVKMDPISHEKVLFSLLYIKTRIL